MNTNKWNNRTCSISLTLTVVLLITVASLLTFPNIPADSAWSSDARYFLAWLLTMAFLLFFCMICGKGISGRYLGVLIDDRNVMSLSRMQMLIWTLLFVSALIIAVMINSKVGSVQNATQEIQIQWQIITLMGISTTSLVGSPLILSIKKDQTPAPSEVDAMQLELNQPGASNDGKVATNASPADARWSDLFTGEEVGNAANVDLSRVQLFYFTVIVALAYAVMLGHMFLTFNGKLISEFPPLNQTLLSLIAISHTGYLTAKAFPHTKSADVQSAGSGGVPDDSAPVNPSASAVG